MSEPLRLWSPRFAVITVLTGVQLPCDLHAREGGQGNLGCRRSELRWPGFATIPKVPSGKYRSQARPMTELADMVPNARESADTAR